MYTVYTALGGDAAGPGMIAYEMERHGSSHAAGIDSDTLLAPKKNAVKARATLAYVSTIYVENSNQERYGDLKTLLANDGKWGNGSICRTFSRVVP